ncbi:MAG: MopE-related protein [Pseudomonadota bacterium]
MSSAVATALPVLLAALLAACGGASHRDTEDSATGEPLWDDADGDGYVDGPDCDDHDPRAFPGASEYCDGVDNDCDGVADEDALDTLAWYADRDGDGYGDALDHKLSCRQPSGYVGDAGDCDDGDAGVHPDAEEATDGVDNDCDGVVDDGGGDDGGQDPYGGTSYDVLDMRLSTDWWTGGAAGAAAGSALSGGHDLTGDGTDDLLLSAPGASTGGEFYFLRGEDLFDATGETLETASAGGGVGWSSPAAGDAMGASLALLRDVEGDGLPDIAVGSPGIDDGAPDTGIVVLWFSSIDAYYYTRTSAAGAQLGPVAGAGDVNGDGLGDILVGAPGMSSSETDQGFAELLLGDASQMVAVGAYWVGDSSYDAVGSVLGSAGDLDGDGRDEIVVTGTGYPAGEAAGAAWIYMGRPRWPGAEVELADSDHQLIGASDGDGVGGALAGGQDFDGDGYDDLVIAAPGGSGTAGTVHLWRGDASWSDTARYGSAAGSDVTFHGDLRGDEAGSSVALLEDFDGDGEADLAVGAPGHSDSGATQGCTYLLLGGPGAWAGNHSLADADLTWLGESAGDRLGTAVATAGDVDGDGHTDLLLGAPGSDRAGTGAGAVYLALGL